MSIADKVGRNDDIPSSNALWISASPYGNPASKRGAFKLFYT